MEPFLYFLFFATLLFSVDYKASPDFQAGFSLLGQIILSGESSVCVECFRTLLTRSEED